MELHNTTFRKDEYKELKMTLNGMGFYEEGMELQEMRQVLDALQLSATETETNFFDFDMQQALRESELDFMSAHDGHVLNSTMIIQPSSSPCSSPDIPPEKMVVQADVHHVMDWSPQNESLTRKRFASTNMSIDNEIFPAELEPVIESLEPETKRFYDICIPPLPINNHDTEIKILEESVHNSAANVSILNSSFEISSNSFREIRGSFSAHRIHDSGFMRSFDTPNSSFNINSSSVKYSSVVSLNNLEKSFSEISNSIHEVVGPYSMRRVNDSGVSTSNVLHEYQNSTYTMENSLHISTSSADNQNDVYDDFEPSI